MAGRFLSLGDRVFEVVVVDRRGGLGQIVGSLAFGNVNSPRVVGLRRALRPRSEPACEGVDILAVSPADEDTCGIVAVDVPDFIPGIRSR